MTAVPPPARPGAAAREEYDVLVAGGGPAGAAAALTLQRAGRRVLLADAGSGPPKTGESLVPAARLLLHDLGVPAAALDARHLPCYANLSAWGSGRLESVDFVRDPWGHGWHLERPVFDRQLRDAARAAGVEVRERRAVGRAHRLPDGGWHAPLSATGPDGTRAPQRDGAVRCRWIVDATGRRAALATRAGARRVRHDRLIALHLALGPAQGDGPPGAGERCSLVESVADGWWYTAPRPEGGRMVAYFTDPDLPSATASTRAALLRRLAGTRHVAARAAGRAVPAGAQPRRGPAHTARLDPVTGDGWTAAGDAAAAFDPLSSQGVLTALYTGLSAGLAVDGLLGGDSGAAAEYAGRVRETFDAYLHGHRLVHAQERRWSRHLFWRRRQGAVAGELPAPV
ncbi:FAD-dependent monooxygenase [Streptomyces sp. HNM0574]|uniref:FAD-dependent monooxygenase n=1 Tax=Streptomyces sp. HNM0574 TaxID=2714954 RepID=UPI00146DC15B|nr:FAD-binding protein [Streptomyces sp. HNM0574]